MAVTDYVAGSFITVQNWGLGDKAWSSSNDPGNTTGAGLNDNWNRIADRLQSLYDDVSDHIADTGNPHNTLPNVTNDAQLKREAGDINTFIEKVLPVSNDILLIEDSADSNNKKKVKIENIFSVDTMPMVSGYWYDSNTNDNYKCPILDDVSYTKDILRAVRFIVQRETTFDRISILHVSTINPDNLARMGIYANGSDNLPGDLVIDAGEIDMSGTGSREIVINQTLTPGIYWLATVQNATFSIKGYNSQAAQMGGSLGANTSSSGRRSLMVTVAHTYGALPDPFGSGSIIMNSDAPRITLRKA